MKKYYLFVAFAFYFFSVGSVFSAQNSFELKIGNLKETINTLDLDKLPQFSFKTTTNYTDEDIFTGVRFGDFAKRYGIKGSKIRVFALDGYSFSMPISELTKYNVIIAYKKGGELMDADTLGPFALVYPRDLYPELNRVDVDAKTIWQLKIISVK